MSQIQQLLTAVNNLTERLSQIESNSKRIYELPQNIVPNGLSKFAISRPEGIGETTEYITLNAILEWCIEEIQNIENSTILVQMLPPELLSGPRRIKIPVVDGDDVDVPIVWKILGVDYVEDTEVIINIPDASEDNYRKDLILGTQDGDVIRMAGFESEEGVIEPVQPENTVLLTSIVVFGDTVYEEPTEPIVGNNFVTKTSQGWFGYQLNPSVLQATPTLGNIHSISFIPFTDGHFITGLNITSVVANKIWNGATFGIRNNSDNYPITLKNMHTGGGKILFNFPSGQDLVLTKEMGVKYFKLGAIPTTGHAYAYCLNDFVSGGVTSDDVSNESNVTGATVTAALNNLDTDKLDKAPNGTDNLIDVDNKLNPVYLPPNIMHLQGEWDASTNTPTLSNGTGIAGYIYEVTTAGTTDFGDGDIEFKLGDWVVYGGNDKWYRSPNTGEVVGVKGDNESAYRKGLVNIDIDDVIEPTANEFLVGNSAGDEWEKRGITGSDLGIVGPGWRIPRFSGSTQAWSSLSVTATPTNSTIAQRSSDGVLKANDAIESDDLVPLGQLEEMLTADNIDYDNTASGIMAETVQEAVDELEDKKLDRVETGSTERVYSVNEANNQAMIPTMEQFVSDTDIINALEAITTEIASISVVGKTMYKGQLYVSDSPAYIYLAYDDNQIIRK